jgi:3-hydroxyacyl-CoA dehydrogenase
MVFVVNSGTMGSGIVQACAQAGYSVAMTDTDASMLKNAIKEIKCSLNKLEDNVKLDIRDQIAVITINRQEKRNALNQEVRTDLIEAAKEIDSKETFRATIIKGEGDAFVTGADKGPMKDYEVKDAFGGLKEWK